MHLELLREVIVQEVRVRARGIFVSTKQTKVLGGLKQF